MGGIGIALQSLYSAVIKVEAFLQKPIASTLLPLLLPPCFLTIHRKDILFL